MSGWNLRNGIIKEYNLSDDEIWSKFNYVFSDSCKKRNTYKFGFIKSLLDNVFNCVHTDFGCFLSYEQIFSKFAENYWNLIVKYNIKQMRPDGRSVYSKIETILTEVAFNNATVTLIDYNSIDSVTKDYIVRKVTSECKKCVIGALYEDFDGSFYSFDLKDNGLYINNCVYIFMEKYKVELEKLNYYSWAKFLEQINDDEALVRLIDKLELSTPKRESLYIYMELLRIEFEYNNCFYCGKKLIRKIHVDHFIPWTFVKDDKLWNFVLACPSCNLKKNNRIPNEKYIDIIEKRNRRFKTVDNDIINNDFKGYYDGLIKRMWLYAKYSGLKEYKY